MNKKQLLIDLVMIADNSNLLKEPSESIEAYIHLKEKAYKNLFDFINLKAED